MFSASGTDNVSTYRPDRPGRSPWIPCLLSKIWCFNADWPGQADCWLGGNARGLPTSWVGRKRLTKRANQSRSPNVLGILGFRAQSDVARGSLCPWRAGNQPLTARIGFRSGLRAAYVAGHPPRFGTRRRPRRWATTLSRCRLAAKKRPNRRPLLRFSSRACQVSAVVPIKDVRPGHRDARGAV